MTSAEIDAKLREIMEYCAESYYPEHEYGTTYKEQNQKHLDEALLEVKKLYAAEVLPKANKLLQEMANMHANMQHDMLRLGLTPTPKNLTDETIKEYKPAL